MSKIAIDNNSYKGEIITIALISNSEKSFRYHFYLDEKYAGAFGVDEKGAFISLCQNINVAQMNFVIAQFMMKRPDMINKSLDVFYVDKI